MLRVLFLQVTIYLNTITSEKDCVAYLLKQLLLLKLKGKKKPQRKCHLSVVWVLSYFPT